VAETLLQMEAGGEKPKPKSVFQRGDKVRVIDGPFVNFQGVVDDINPERGRMKVVVPVFGRPTPVELAYYQVERLGWMDGRRPRPRQDGACTLASLGEQRLQ